jgi:hypothetical protein
MRKVGTSSSRATNIRVTLSALKSAVMTNSYRMSLRVTAQRGDSSNTTPGTAPISFRPSDRIRGHLLRVARAQLACGFSHMPALDDVTPPDGKRAALGVLILLLPIVVLLPLPLAQTSSP